MRLVLEPGVRHDAVDEAERQRLLARPRYRRCSRARAPWRSPRAGEEPAAAEVAGVADPGERGARTARCRSRRAGHTPAPGRARRPRPLPGPSRWSASASRAASARLPSPSEAPAPSPREVAAELAALGHGLHVAARAEAPAGAGEDDHADLRHRRRAAAAPRACASSIGPDMALSRSGRFSVSTATPSLTVSSRSRAINDSPECARWYTGRAEIQALALAPVDVAPAPE